jgi:hypothetical protein
MTQPSSAIATVTSDLAAACGGAAELALTLSKGFLILAIVVAVLETGLALWVKLHAARKGPVVADSALESIVPAVDPVKLLDALKGLLQTLKALPAWIAIFLAGVLLFWVAGRLASDGCAPVADPATAPPPQVTPQTPAEADNPQKP